MVASHLRAWQWAISHIGAGLFARTRVDVATPQGTGMLTISQQTCEVKVDGAWQPATFAEARSLYTMPLKRCPDFHGQVILAGNYVGAGSLKLQHRRPYSGCQLKPVTYFGTPSRHPHALD
jgi:hypothetical protein